MHPTQQQDFFDQLDSYPGVIGSADPVDVRAEAHVFAVEPDTFENCASDHERPRQLSGESSSKQISPEPLRISLNEDPMLAKHDVYRRIDLQFLYLQG